MPGNRIVQAEDLQKAPFRLSKVYFWSRQLELELCWNIHMLDELKEFPRYFKVISPSGNLSRIKGS